MPKTRTFREAPTTLRIPKQLMDRTKSTAKVLGMSYAQVIRIALGVGIEHLKRIDFDLSSAVMDSSDKKELESLRQDETKKTPAKSASSKTKAVETSSKKRSR